MRIYESCNHGRKPIMKDENQSKENLKSQLANALQRLSELEDIKNKCKFMETELRQQNEFFHHVLESLTHPFYVLDANDYTIKVANSAARLGDLSSKPTCFALTHRRDKPCSGNDWCCLWGHNKGTEDSCQ